VGSNPTGCIMEYGTAKSTHKCPRCENFLMYFINSTVSLVCSKCFYSQDSGDWKTPRKYKKGKKNDLGKTLLRFYPN
jgi:DNA-directed RNA polymerase subunit M/transcription elongation factor TFIIS